MDELTFRRTLYADPRTRQTDVLNAIQDDTHKRRFWEELQAFENEIEAALDIDVPDNLSQKLLLKQSIKIETEARAKQPWYWAMAATIALAAVLSFALITPTTSSLTFDAITHVAHASTEVSKYGPLDMQTVNAKLANYNGTMSDDLGEILSANFCYLDHIKSLHLIIKGETGLLSLFVLPEEGTAPVENSFSNHEYNGLSFLLESTRVIVVGEDESELQSFSQRAREYLSFSA